MTGPTEPSDGGSAPDPTSDATPGPTDEPGDEGAVTIGAAAPAAGLAGRTAVDGDGAYWRDADGTWRYRDGGDPVPGATDLCLEDLFDPPVEMRDGHEVRVVPRPWASRRPDHPLAWVFEHAELGARAAIPVPEPAWAARATTVVAMAAPELHPHNLFGVDAVAALVGVTPATVRAYLARGQMPAPTGRIGGSPVWPRPLIDRWLPTRRRTAATRPPDLPADADPALDSAAEAADARSPAEVEPEPASRARRRRPLPRTGPATDGG